MAGEPGLAPHWDDAHAQGETTRSWFEQQPDMSLRMLGSAGISAADAVIDVGGGASPLAQTLLNRGFDDITVLDFSVAGMQYAQRRLGPRAEQVRWLTADVLTWQPERWYQAQEHITHRPGSSSPSPGWRCASRHDCRPQHLPARRAGATWAVRDRVGLH